MINGGKKEITGRSEQTWVFFTRRIGLKHNILLRISLRPLLACGSGSAHFTEANSQALSMDGLNSPNIVDSGGNKEKAQIPELTLCPPGRGSLPGAPG